MCRRGTAPSRRASHPRATGAGWDRPTSRPALRRDGPRRTAVPRSGGEAGGGIDIPEVIEPGGAAREFAHGSNGIRNAWSVNNCPISAVDPRQLCVCREPPPAGIAERRGDHVRDVGRPVPGDERFEHRPGHREFVGRRTGEQGAPASRSQAGARPRPGGEDVAVRHTDGTGSTQPARGQRDRRHPGRAVGCGVRARPVLQVENPILLQESEIATRQGHSGESGEPPPRSASSSRHARSAPIVRWRPGRARAKAVPPSASALRRRCRRIGRRSPRGPGYRSF